MDDLQELIAAALAVASAPPLRPGQYVSDAKVPWSRIVRLRDALDAAGLGEEWRARSKSRR